MARKAITPRRDTADALTVLGQQIKRARLARGWTVVDTAQRLGISATTYAGIEAGSRRPPSARCSMPLRSCAYRCSPQMTRSRWPGCVGQASATWG